VKSAWIVQILNPGATNTRGANTENTEQLLLSHWFLLSRWQRPSGPAPGAVYEVLSIQ